MSNKKSDGAKDGRRTYRETIAEWVDEWVTIQNAKWVIVGFVAFAALTVPFYVAHWLFENHAEVLLLTLLVLVGVPTALAAFWLLGGFVLAAWGEYRAK